MSKVTAEQAIQNHRVVSREAWLEARKRLLAREKELTHLRDQIARERRALPWVRDIAPKGRDEEQLAYPMEWVRHHDRYEPVPAGGSCCGGCMPDGALVR